MNPISQRIFNLIAICLAAGLIFIAIGARWYVDSLETARRTEFAHLQQGLTAELGAIRGAVSQLQYETAALIASNKTVAANLAAEQTARANETARSAATISRLQEDLKKAAAPDLSQIISSWRPRVAQVKCRWDFPDTSSHEASGSGVLMSGSPVSLFTNRHVITYRGITANWCTVKLPEENILSVAYTNDLHPSPSGEDWATITIAKPSVYTRTLAANPVERCGSKAAIGESVVILGYPTIGSLTDVTATEGIISAFEDNYYISSAKVERGNSGGAAILAKKNCYLGIPTFVGAGQLETLARILDERVMP